MQRGAVLDGGVLKLAGSGTALFAAPEVGRLYLGAGTSSLPATALAQIVGGGSTPRFGLVYRSAPLVPICAPMRFTVQVKLLAAFALVAGLMILVGVFAVARLRSDNQHLGLLASRVVPSTRAVGDINALMNKYRKDQLHYILAKPSDRPLGVPGSIAGDLQDDLSLMSTSFSAYAKGGLVEDVRDRQLLGSFQHAFGRYVAITAPFSELADSGATSRAAAVVGEGAGDAQWDKLKSLIGDWNNHKVATAAAEQRASHASYRFGLILIGSLLAAAVAMAIGVAIGLARRMTRAVREIGIAAKAISHGEIDQSVAIRSRDEFGEMARDFDEMVDYLRSTVAVAESVAAGKLEIEVRPRSSSDALGNALLLMTSSLRRLVADNEHLLAASREEANTDALTSLPNRRALMRDLEGKLGQASDDSPLMLGLFDLDGFKQYNDTFGHSAGDALLVRLSDRLNQALNGSATSYRMGGDEFCVLAHSEGNRGAAIARTAAHALSESGEAFQIGCSYGIVSIPADAVNVEDALRLADKRMYELKAGRSSASRQSTDVLLKVLDEHSPGLGTHISAVAQLARSIAIDLQLPEHEVKRIELAAELHDIGKVALPHTILNKPGPLETEEWNFMRRHPEIGERIVSAAPSLTATADLIRSSHERYDGTGYPDRLANDQIPLGARIIAVCDAYDAMTSNRAYSDAVSHIDALNELRRCAGQQFDPKIVDAFCTATPQPALARDAA